MDVVSTPGSLSHFQSSLEHTQAAKQRCSSHFQVPQRQFKFKLQHDFQVPFCCCCQQGASRRKSILSSPFQFVPSLISHGDCDWQHVAPERKPSASVIRAPPLSMMQLHRVCSCMLGRAHCEQRVITAGHGRTDSHSQQLVATTTSIVKTLREYEAQPRKGLGQYFMVESEVNTKLVDAAGIVPGDVVLEVGPGTGALTERLLNAGALVLAVEKDAKMVEALSSRFADVPEVQLVIGDILKWDIRYHISKVLSALGNVKRAKIVSNLPFNITSEFLMTVLPMGSLFSTIVLLVQEETARRLVDAGPGDGGLYRQANVMLRFFGEPEYVFSVSRRCFYPQPKVDAAILKVSLRTPDGYPLLVSSHTSYSSTLKAFSNMVASAFQGKRKMLKNSLKSLYGSEVVSEALQVVDLPSTARPDRLSLEDFVKIFNALENTHRKSKEMAETAPQMLRSMSEDSEKA